MPLSGEEESRRLRLGVKRTNVPFLTGRGITSVLFFAADDTLLGSRENETFGETAMFGAGSYGLNWGNLR